MLYSESKVRVRYGETDKMGYVYYGNYPLYFEVARTEMIRRLGCPYNELEAKGIMLPVLSMNIKYIRPAFYDDELKVKVIMKELPDTRISFEYEIYNQNNKLITVGSTTLVFVSAKTMQPTKPPAELYAKIEKAFNQPENDITKIL